MIKFARISKNGFLGRFGTVRPKSRKTGFFGKNPAGSTFFEYCPPTSGQKSGKSLEPFSRNFRFTTVFGPFWAILGHWKLQNSLKSKILIFWPKMTKCQTNLVRKKNFHRFFGFFLTQNHSNRKKKFLKIFHFYSKFWPKMTLFGPNFDPKSQIWPKIFFSWSWKSTISNEGSHAYVWKSSIFRSVLGPLGPNSGEPEFSGQIGFRNVSLILVP